MIMTNSKKDMNEVKFESASRFQDWNLLRSFIVIYETGTLTDAAVRLNSTQPSMGRHLRDLESSLKEPLFTRLPGKMKPTARADLLYETLLGMRNSAREANNLFTGDNGSIAGIVRIATSEAYGYHVIPPLITPLLEKNKDLEIELSVSNQTDNLLRRDADMAVRFFRPQQENLITMKVGETEMGLFAHEKYLATHGVPTDIEQTSNLVLAGFDREPVKITGVIQGPQPIAPVKFRFRTDFVLAWELAVLSGSAMAVMFVDIANKMPGLVRVLPQRICLKQEVWLCAHEELRRSTRMRYVWEHLEAGLRLRFSA
jgi:DNA-binding transcriptional LysR family regulator